MAKLASTEITPPKTGLAANRIGKAYRGRVVVKDLIEADRGIITLDGENITKLPMYQRARLGVGYLPQEQSIFRGLTVEENIAPLSSSRKKTGPNGMIMSMPCLMS